MSKTKRQILSSALDCFMNKGVEQTTIADIRELSGISVGSIYHHFGNKEGIAAALFQSAMRDHASLLEQALEDSKTAEEGVKTIVRCYAGWIVNNPEWAKFVFRYRGLVESSEHYEEHQARQRAHFSKIRTWFKPHVESGDIRALSVELYHPLVIGPAQDFAVRWLEGRTKSSLESHLEQLADAAWRAVKH